MVQLFLFLGRYFIFGHFGVINRNLNVGKGLAVSYALVLLLFYKPSLYNFNFLYFFQIRTKDFERFQFVGAKDLAAMFDFFTSSNCVRDYKLTKKLNSDIRSFDKWLHHNKEVIDEELKKE